MRWTHCAWLGVTLALAAPSSAWAGRLTDDAPAASRPLTLLAERAPVTFGEHLAKTVTAGVFGSTAGVLVAVPLGALSNSLIWAALPVLLSNLFLPPLVTVLAALLIGNVDQERFGFGAAFGGAFVVNAAAFAIASLFFTVPWANPAALLVYTLVDGLLMSATTVGVMHLFPKKPAASVTLHSFVPGVSDTTVVPSFQVSF